MRTHWEIGVVHPPTRRWPRASAKAVAAAYEILKPGGRLVILDLKRHTFEEARELYADIWLGFAEVELDGFLRSAGFGGIQVFSVHRETDHPYFETLLAIGEKSSS